MGGEGRIHRSRAGLVDVAQPPVCRYRVEDQLGATARQGGLISGVECGEEAGEDLPRDLGGEVGRPLGERVARVRASGHLPGDRQVPQAERLVRQDPLRPPQGVGADVQDGAAQDLTVLRRLLRLLAPADERQAHPAQVGERVGDGVVEASIVTGQVPRSDPVRGRDAGRSGWIDREVGMQVRLQGAGGLEGLMPPAVRAT